MRPRIMRGVSATHSPPRGAKDSKLEDAKMKSDRAQVAHLMRRAGFGATPEELDKLTAEKDLRRDC